MVRRLIVVIAAFSMSSLLMSHGPEKGGLREEGERTRESACRCDVPTEAEQLARFADKLSRRGN